MIQQIVPETQAPTPEPQPPALPPHVQQALATERPCPRCGAIDVPALGPGTQVHYARLTCRHCQSFLQWISQYTDEERLAREQQRRRAAMASKAPTELQLQYLRALGDRGPTPANMQEASDRIDQLRKKGGAA
jgi:hypothetical protein